LTVRAGVRASISALQALNRSDLFNEFLGYGSSTVLMHLTRAGSGLVAAALLGPATWGSWYLLNLILAYGALTHLGVLNGMNREVPAALGRGETGEAAALRRTALGTTVTFTGITTLAVALGFTVIRGAALTHELMLVLGLLIAHQLFAYAAMSLKSTVRFSSLARVQFVMATAYPLFCIPGAWLYGLPGFIFGQLLVYVLACWLAGTSAEVLREPKLEPSKAQVLIRTGLPIMLVGLVHTMFATVDRWVVVTFLGQEPLGHYSLAIMALGAVGLLPQVIAQQFYPRMAMAWSAHQDGHELRRLAARQRALTLGVVAPVVAALAFLGPIAVRELLPEYAPGIGALLIMLFVPLVVSIGQAYGNIMHVLNRQSWYLAAIAGSAAVNVVASIALVTRMGLVGVALATIAAFACLAGTRVFLGHLALRRASVD
jgi:O-antigen/teichoic acid export membrane protein